MIVKNNVLVAKFAIVRSKKGLKVFATLPESQSTPARLQPKKACIETKDEERTPKVETNGG